MIGMSKTIAQSNWQRRIVKQHLSHRNNCNGMMRSLTMQYNHCWWTVMNLLLLFLSINSSQMLLAAQSAPTSMDDSDHYTSNIFATVASVVPQPTTTQPVSSAVPTTTLSFAPSTTPNVSSIEQEIGRSTRSTSFIALASVLVLGVFGCFIISYKRCLSFEPECNNKVVWSMSDDTSTSEQKNECYPRKESASNDPDAPLKTTVHWTVLEDELRNDLDLDLEGQFDVPYNETNLSNCIVEHEESIEDPLLCFDIPNNSLYDSNTNTNDTDDSESSTDDIDQVNRGPIDVDSGCTLWETDQFYDIRKSSSHRQSLPTHKRRHQKRPISCKYSRTSVKKIRDAYRKEKSDCCSRIIGLEPILENAISYECVVNEHLNECNEEKNIVSTEQDSTNNDVVSESVNCIELENETCDDLDLEGQSMNPLSNIDDKLACSIASNNSFEDHIHTGPIDIDSGCIGNECNDARNIDDDTVLLEDVVRSDLDLVGQSDITYCNTYISTDNEDMEPALNDSIKNDTDGNDSNLNENYPIQSGLIDIDSGCTDCECVDESNCVQNEKDLSLIDYKCVDCTGSDDVVHESDHDLEGQFDIPYFDPEERRDDPDVSSSHLSNSNIRTNDRDDSESSSDDNYFNVQSGPIDIDSGCCYQTKSDNAFFKVVHQPNSLQRQRQLRNQKIRHSKRFISRKYSLVSVCKIRDVYRTKKASCNMKLQPILESAGEHTTIEGCYYSSDDESCISITSCSCSNIPHGTHPTTSSSLVPVDMPIMSSTLIDCESKSIFSFKEAMV